MLVSQVEIYGADQGFESVAMNTFCLHTTGGFLNY